jgi:hypothetical protein
LCEAPDARKFELEVSYRQSDVAKHPLQVQAPEIYDSCDNTVQGSKESAAPEHITF